MTVLVFKKCLNPLSHIINRENFCILLKTSQVLYRGTFAVYGITKIMYVTGFAKRSLIRAIINI